MGAKEEKRVIAIAACPDGCDNIDVKAIQAPGPEPEPRPEPEPDPEPEQVDAALRGRENTVMTRLSNETLEKLDALVEIELFKSRSEAAAHFITQGIESKSELFDRIMPTITKIQQLKDQLKKELK